MDPTGAHCEAFAEVADETNYLDAAKDEIEPIDFDEQSDSQYAQAEDAQQEEGEREETTPNQQRAVIEKYNSTINKWVTVAGAVLGPLEEVKSAGGVLSKEAANAQSGIKAISGLKILKVTNVALTYTGLVTDIIGVMTAGIAKLEAEINGGSPKAIGDAHDALLTAAWSLGKDVLLASTSAHPIGLCFNVMNGILTGIDDQWFAKLINEDWDGPDLAKAIEKNISGWKAGADNEAALAAHLSGGRTRQASNSIKRHTGTRPRVSNPSLEALGSAVDQHNGLLLWDDTEMWVEEVRRWTNGLARKDGAELDEIVGQLQGSTDFDDTLAWLEGDLSAKEFSTVKSHFASLGL